ncbi:MAG: hypothetical protein WEG56_05235 [Chloroflexota bacterium]
MLVVLAVGAGLASAACEVFLPPAAFDPAHCDVRRLDEVADPVGLFRGIPCVIVTWDTEMEGAGIGADGGIGTPPALREAATGGGYATPCETTVSPDPASPGQLWFVNQFGALEPTAEIWGATLFVPLPMPDGLNPACIAVTPPLP